MAYRQRRRTFRKRRTYRRRSGGMWNIAKKAASKLVKYYLNPEYKFLDDTSTTTVSSAGSIDATICTLAQGDTVNNRNGNSIKVTSHLLRYTITRNSLADTTSIRLVLFTDVSSAGVGPSVTDVLQNASVLSPLNQVNGSRFKILMDRHYSLSSDRPIITSQYFKKMNHHIKYLDATANSSSLGQGPIYMLMISNQATNTPTLAFQSRMRFLDN